MLIARATYDEHESQGTLPEVGSQVGSFSTSARGRPASLPLPIIPTVDVATKKVTNKKTKKVSK
jgi:hypothetical protein